MSQILHFLKESLSFSASETSRSHALMRGLPAILIAIAALSAISWASFGHKEQLEREYSQRAAASKKEKLELAKVLQTEIRILQASRSGSSSNDGPLIAVDDERRIKLSAVQNEERIFLEKLISLNPDEFDYRFELALVSFENRDLQRGLALMQQAAPENEPRFAKAHLWLAKYYLRLKTVSVAESRRNKSLALKHVEHSITRGLESENETTEAKLIKAQLLFQQGRQEPAYEIFEQLFADNVVFYRPMIQINRALGREERSAQILDTAISEYRSKLEDEGLSIEDWVEAWKNIFVCLKETKDFARAEKMLKAELEVQVNSQDSPAKQKFVEQLLSSIYQSWSATLLAEITTKLAEAKRTLRVVAQADPQSAEAQELKTKIAKLIQQLAEAQSQRLELLKLAYQYNPIAPKVMTDLTSIIIGGDSTLADAARQVYDPTRDPSAPASVLNVLGSDALQKEAFEDAIRYYELARRKAPGNSMILNNLAVSYLVCENRNPERALKLVDEAIRSLQNNSDAKIARSNFFDTRGTALMQLNRMTEAAAALEIAIQDRPNNRKILESLVKCYEGNNLSPGIYLERLKKLDEQDGTSSSDSADRPQNGPLGN